LFIAEKTLFEDNLMVKSPEKKRKHKRYEHKYKKITIKDSFRNKLPYSRT
jgi:hypothetical protein